jgi:hypothetical protein
MDLKSGTAVLFTAAFPMPGFVWSAVLSMFLPRKAKQGDNRFLEFFTLNCINNSIWFALFLYFALRDYFTRNPLAASVWVFVALFVSPLLLGIISAKMAQTDLLAGLLRRFEFRTVHYIKSARDWHFSRQRTLWAVVTLKDGSRWYYGSDSFAGDDPKDIYLEKVCKPEENRFGTTEDNHGALVMADQISVVEFFRNPGEING